jgi:hypothetical protein
MPVKISCPNCEAGLSMPESMFGKQVRCPKCQKPFQCPTGEEAVTTKPRSAPAPARSGSSNPFDFEEAPARRTRDSAAEVEFEPDEDEVDRSYRRRPRRTGWERVRGGGTFLCISAGMFLVFYLIYFFFFGQPRTPTSTPPSLGLVKTMLILECLLIMGAAGCGALGMSMCMTVPHTSFAKGAALGSMVSLLLCAVCSFLVTVIIMMLLFGSAPGPGILKALFYLALALIGSLVAGFVFCIFYLTILATFLTSRAMLGSVVAHGVFLMVSPFIFVAISTLPALMGGSPMGGGPMGGGPMGGGPMGSGPPSDGPGLSAFLGLLMIMGAIGWFITNVLSLNGAISRAKRLGKI